MTEHISQGRFRQTLFKAPRWLARRVLGRLRDYFATPIRLELHNTREELRRGWLRDNIEGTVRDIEGTVRALDTLVLSLLRSLPRSDHSSNSSRFHAIPLTPDRVLASHPLTDFLYVDPADRFVTPRIVLGTYQPGVLRLLQRLIRPGDRIVELGCHQGYHTLSLARLVCPGGKVFAFEPHSVHHAVLRDNLQTHDLTGVVTHVEGDLRIDAGTRLVRIGASMLSPGIVDGLSVALAANPDLELLLDLTPDTPASLIAQLAALGLHFQRIGEEGDLVPFEPLGPSCRVEVLAARKRG